MGRGGKTWVKDGNFFDSLKIINQSIISTSQLESLEIEICSSIFQS